MFVTHIPSTHLSLTLLSVAVSENLRKWALTPPPSPTLPPPPIQLLLSLLLRVASLLYIFRPSRSRCISPLFPFLHFTQALDTSHMRPTTFRIFLQFNSATWCLSPGTELFFLHNHCWWGFHFEHLLISHFFPSPPSLRLLDFIDVSFACILMIYLCAHHNKFD